MGLYDFGSRFYDPYLGRWFCQDPALQMMSPYAYCGNNPLAFVDPDGESFIVAFLVGLAVSAVIDYSIQVAVNYASGYRGKDAWVRKVDFFDMAVCGVIGGLTAGFGTIAQSGQKVGQFGSFLLKNQKLISLGETLLTSTVDITGEGWQDVSFGQVGTRLLSAGATYAARTGLKEVMGKNKNSINQFAEVPQAGNDPYSLQIGEAKLTTSSRSTVPSRNYSVYNEEGKLLKFGVTDAGLNRMNQSVRGAGEGAWAKFSGIKPKWEAHLHEKYMRSLFYNSTGVYKLPKMKIPFPVDFNTGMKVKSPLK